jgi:hypothetical protein
MYRNVYVCWVAARVLIEGTTDKSTVWVLQNGQSFVFIHVDYEIYTKKYSDTPQNLHF